MPLSFDLTSVYALLSSLGLGACPVEGFVEDSMNDLLGLDGVDERVLYRFVIGREHRTAAP